MQTTEIGAAGTHWPVLIDVRVIDWLTANVKNEPARHELVIAYHAWTRRGYFSINTGRVDACHGSACRKAIRKALVDCPFIRLTRDAKIKKHAAIHQFFGLDSKSKTSHLKQPTDSALSGASPRVGRCRRVVLDCQWLRQRAIRWCSWCLERGFDIACDFFGITERAKAIFDSISRVGLPENDDFTNDIDDEKNATTGRSKRDWARDFVAKCRRGSVLRVSRIKSGRLYQPLTNAPRLMRREMTIDGEKMTEVDLSSAYWAVLSAELPDSDERDRMIDSLQAGLWYSDLAAEAGVEFATNGELKVATQTQCLTGQDQRLESRPLWVALKRLYPTLSRIIQRIRDESGASGLTHFLTSLEGRVMAPVHLCVIALGIPALPLHDGILVPLSAAERVADVIRTVATEKLGFTPLVKIK